MNETGNNILYITYDGLTDPLGQSQILPYIIGLTKSGYRFTILSFEKKERYKKGEETIRKILDAHQIRWVPLFFTSSPPVLSKFYDALRMQRKAFILHRKFNFCLVHCRSYIAADIGLKMKRRLGTKFFFDMRGFWADEKKDGGSWDQSNLIFRQVYRYYKNREAQYLQHADFVISLTQNGLAEMKTWPSFRPNLAYEVIPCCADTDHFTITSAAGKTEARKQLGIPADCFVVSYLGSVGTWYMLDEMLLFFKTIKEKYKPSRFLFLTQTDPALIRKKVTLHSIDMNDILIREASRKEVPVFMKASDINLSFIKQVYSKISSSPTKLGEVLSMGIPVICNSGVGDVEQVVTDCQGGYVLHDFNAAEFARAVNAVPSLLNRSPSAIREQALKYYSLDRGVELYTKAYKQIFSK